MSFSLKMIDSVHYILLKKASFQNSYCEVPHCPMLTVHCRVLAAAGVGWSRLVPVSSNQFEFDDGLPTLC